MFPTGSLVPSQLSFLAAMYLSLLFVTKRPVLSLTQHLEVSR